MNLAEDKGKCCGCSACMNVCSQNAIQMKPDEEGFLYPEIDSALCIHCRACERVCPVVHKETVDDKEKPLEAYAIRCKDEKICRSTSSGGVFTALARYLAEKGAVIYGAAYTQEFEVVHARTEKSSDCMMFATSKYVQSNLGDIFQSVKKDLEAGRKVCFSGTPCQIEGLLRCLGGANPLLLTVDVVCHGVPSPAVWKNYLNEMRKKNRNEIEEINFRDKKFGYHSSLLKIRYKSGKEYFGSKRNDPYIKSFFSNIDLRPSCYQCVFKTARHASDITLFDCKSFEKLTGAADDDKGYTNVFINSQKGKEAIKSIEHLIEIHPVDPETAIACDGSMVLKSAPKHKARDRFIADCNRHGMREAVQINIPITAKDRIIVKTRGALNSLGILNTARSLFHKGK